MDCKEKVLSSIYFMESVLVAAKTPDDVEFFTNELFELQKIYDSL